MIVLSLCLGAEAAVVRLGDLDLTKMSSGWGKPLVDQSVTGKAISIAGRTFDYGVGTHAESALHVTLDGKVERFRPGGVDEEPAAGDDPLTVYGDRRLFDSGVMKVGRGQARGCRWRVSRLKLLVTGARGRFDHADERGGVFLRGRNPGRRGARRRRKEIRTPKPGPKPRLNGRRCTALAGRPFLYRFCTGPAYPIHGATAAAWLDANTGIITGPCQEPGRRHARVE
jgi:alpha-galactosidase